MFISLTSSTPFSIVSYFTVLSTLSFHLCLTRPFGLFVLGFHSVICPIIFSDLHMCQAQSNNFENTINIRFSIQVIDLMEVGPNLIFSLVVNFDNFHQIICTKIANNLHIIIYYFK